MQSTSYCNVSAKIKIHMLIHNDATEMCRAKRDYTEKENSEHKM